MVNPSCRLLAGQSSSHLMLHWGQWAKPLCLSVYHHSVPTAAAAVSCDEAACQHGPSNCDWNEYDCIIWNLLPRPPPPQTWYKSNRIKIYLLPLRHLSKNNLLYCVTDTASPLLFTWHAQLYLPLYAFTQPSTTAWLTTCDREALDFRSVWVCERIGFPTGIYFGCCGY